MSLSSLATSILRMVCNRVQAAQIAMPQRMESKGSSDLDMLNHQGGLSGGGRGASFAARSFSLPPPASHSGLQQYGSTTYGSGAGGFGGTGAGGIAAAVTASAAMALRGTPPIANDPIGALLHQQPWGLPFSLPRTSAFDAPAAGVPAGFDSRVLSPQPRYPGENGGGGAPGGGGGGHLADGGNLLWGSMKAAAAAAVTRPPMFNQNAAAIRFLEGQQRAAQQAATAAASTPLQNFVDIYSNAADLISKAGMAGARFSSATSALSVACVVRVVIGAPSVISALTMLGCTQWLTPLPPGGGVLLSGHVPTCSCSHAGCSAVLAALLPCLADHRRL